jgi:type VI secretion system protein VasG
MLPALSREFLKRALAKEEPKEAKVTIENGDFAYAWS